MNAPRQCPECPVGAAVERRAFLRDTLARVAVSLGALGALSRPASALSVVFASGSGTGAEKAYPIPAADGVVIDKEESVIVARFAGKAYAFSLACPHQNTALRWDASNNRFQCPKHRSRYQPDGVFIEGRATRGLDRFAVRRSENSILVNLDVLFQEDRNPTEWAAAFLPLGNEK